MTVHNEADLLRRIAKATSLQEKASLVQELENLRATTAAQIQQDRDVQWADTVVTETLRPALAHVYHTAATDWMDDLAPEDSTNAHQAMMAEASVWFNRLSPEVREDSEEFTQQMRGMARRLAGRYGHGAEGAREAFTQYATFLRTQAASGLDQIQQTTAPDGVTEKPTPLPTDVFDTFQQPLAEGNPDGVPSTGNPMWNTINGWTPPAGGRVGDGRPSEHDENDSLEYHYGPGAAAGVQASLSEDADADPFGSLYSQSVALNYVGNLAEWSERLAAEAAADEFGDPDHGKCSLPWCDEPATKKGGHCAKHEKKKSAATVEHLATYVVGGFGQFDHQPPSFNDGDECPECGSRGGYGVPGASCPDCYGSLDGMGMCPSCQPHGERSPWEQEHLRGHASRREAASGLDQIDQTIDANNQPKTTPYPGEVMFPLNPAFSNEPKTMPESDANEGGAHHVDHSAAAKTADMFGNSDEPHKVPGDNNPLMHQTFAEPKKADKPEGKKDVPGSMEEGAQKAKASKDYDKAYKFASKWKAGDRLVATGSADFEAGLYDGIKANSLDNRLAWVAAHRTQSQKHAYLGERMVAHAQRTAVLKTGATTMDLDTSAPSTSPTVNTPFNGPGTKPPLSGGDAATSGGPAPYNGAEPRGHSVVPGVEQAPKDHISNEPSDVNPGSSVPQNDPQQNALSPQTAAFRRRVQAAMVAEANNLINE